jgi:hypothetical protein
MTVQLASRHALDSEPQGGRRPGLVFPTIASFLLSAILFASNKKRLAVAIAATTLAGYLALDASAIALHLTGGGRAARPAVDSPKQ